MKHVFYKIALLVFIISVIGCARRGSITGGLKDTLAPVLKNSIPKNFSTEFTAKQIQLQFDEYVKLKDLNKQLIVSPPLKNQPEIVPLTPSKSFIIRLKDTLQPNTTYSFNFGNSIEDNNEGNALEQFKYVFSTGKTLDSLKFKVEVKDALEQKTDRYVSIMLYEKNEQYNDSVVYKMPPRYIGNTLDSIKTVELENLKAGKYKLIAIKDVNHNNKYDPKTDKIGFQKEFISLPNDKIYELSLFKETPSFKTTNIAQLSGSRFSLGYEGNAKNTQISVKKSNVEIPYVVTKLPKKDSLQVWFKASKQDSLNILVKKDNFSKSYSLKIKDQKKDTLSLSPEKQGTLHYREKLLLNSSTPLEKWDLSKIKLIKKDSSQVNFTMQYDKYNQQLEVLFKREPLENYTLKFHKGSVTDFYGNTIKEDLVYKFSTNSTSEYGNLKIILENAKSFPILIELTDANGKVLASEYSEGDKTVLFENLQPNKFILRLIFDENKNKKWDAGNFLENRQSEEVIYFPKEIDVRANWDVEQPVNAR